jgi:3-hydroxyisobutyrate dehydrogenase
MPEQSNHVAVIGLGAMGLPMAAHLATVFSVTGFDPFKARRDLAAERNLAVAGTPADASKSADIALLAVRDHTQAHSALFAASRSRPSPRPVEAAAVGACRGVGRERAVAPAWHESGLVFTSRLGTPVDPRNFHRAFVIGRSGPACP